MNKDILLLGAKDIEQVLKGKETDILEVIKNVYIYHEEGKSSLPQSIFLRFPDSPSNRIIGLPAYLGGKYNSAGIKWISSFPKNIANGEHRASAVSIINNTDNGRCKTILESSFISATRTAASAALAARELHQHSETIVGLVGCGEINKMILNYLKIVFPSIKKVVLFDIDKERAIKFAANSNNMAIEFEIVDKIEQVFKETKLISFATTAATPYINKLEHCDENTTILNISLRDFSSEIIQNCDNIVDDISHVLRENTSLHLAQKELKNTDFIRSTLANILMKTKERRIGKPLIFSPFGLGVLDLGLSSYIEEYAIENDIGVIIHNFLP